MRAAEGGGAVATASRSVIRDRVAAVSRSASSTSRRICDRSRQAARGARASPGDDERVGVEAVAGVGRHPPGGGVGMAQIALALERCELCAHRRRTPIEVRILGDRGRADRLAGLEVGADDQVENPLLALGEHDAILGSTRWPTRTPSPTTSPSRVDDGAADHLAGAPLPRPGWRSRRPMAAGSSRRRSPAAPSSTPTRGPGGPGQALLADDWDLIPGARGCTPETCGFRDHHAELLDGRRRVGVRALDPGHRLSSASWPSGSGCRSRSSRTPSWRSPRRCGCRPSRSPARTLIKRLTLLVREGSIERVWYPVFPPDRHASEVLEYVAATGRRSADASLGPRANPS